MNSLDIAKLEDMKILKKYQAELQKKLKCIKKVQELKNIWENLEEAIT
jgi:hypothetical protein